MHKEVAWESNVTGEIRAETALEARRPGCSAGQAASGRRPGRRRRPGGSGAGWFARAGGGHRPPNLLILGASGHVAQACLRRLEARRSSFGRLVCVDPSPRLLHNAHLNHRRLRYEFLCRGFKFPEDTPCYHALLRRHRIDIVLDLTDLDTLPILAATDAAGVSYVNTALNDGQRGVAEVVGALHPTRTQARLAPHIISTGMNPGVVNIWVWHGFQEYGPPTEIVHFEYDSSEPESGWRPMTTWSRGEFLAETVWEPTGVLLNGRLRMLPGNALQHREELRTVMEPVFSLPSYPRGLIVLHEENVKLGQKLGASSKYIYAIHPRTMDHLERLWQERGRVEVADLEVGNNTSIPLRGADTIGVCLEYPDQRVYYVHSLANDEVTGTNATCAQVAVGVEAGLTALLAGGLSPRLYFASDLYDTVYSDVVFSELRVDHFVFAKEDGALRLRRHVPALGESTRVRRFVGV
ncbi:MAG TPA: saccharopine dehydrogenase NADP-binding domain-containing protein [Verrucomicrobiota bacterium]|nr:saccharopine dehydrogenase NADP-binding domain-containing protein [Verrucomicrobiota bacterium]HQL79473.1 saccharopine dehydrogenase NADP-binding domain-containing protein [Verrucomicrobiota bacterium]